MTLATLFRVADGVGVSIPELFEIAPRPDPKRSPGKRDR